MPPAGDPLAWVSPAWHAALQAGQEVLALDLKTAEGQARLADAPGGRRRAAHRHIARRRWRAWGLPGRPCRRAARSLCHVAIVGYPPPNEDRAGHDLTYQASVGLLEPPAFPRLPLADYAGSERAVSATLALLWARDRTGRGGQATVSLVEALAPYAHALLLRAAGAGHAAGWRDRRSTTCIRPKRGGWPWPRWSRTSGARLAAGLGLTGLTYETLAQAFLAAHRGRVGRVGRGTGYPPGGGAGAVVSIDSFPNQVSRRNLVWKRGFVSGC